MKHKLGLTKKGQSAGFKPMYVRLVSVIVDSVFGGVLVGLAHRVRCCGLTNFVTFGVKAIEFSRSIATSASANQAAT
jgi:hypothetical protein